MSTSSKETCVSSYLASRHTTHTHTCKWGPTLCLCPAQGAALAVIHPAPVGAAAAAAAVPAPASAARCPGGAEAPLVAAPAAAADLAAAPGLLLQPHHSPAPLHPVYYPARFLPQWPLHPLPLWLHQKGVHTPYDSSSVLRLPSSQPCPHCCCCCCCHCCLCDPV